MNCILNIFDSKCYSVTENGIFSLQRDPVTGLPIVPLAPMAVDVGRYLLRIVFVKHKGCRFVPWLLTGQRLDLVTDTFPVQQIVGIKEFQQLAIGLLESDVPRDRPPTICLIDQSNGFPVSLGDFPRVVA